MLQWREFPYLFTILVGCIVALIGATYNAALPRETPTVTYKESMNQDHLSYRVEVRNVSWVASPEFRMTVIGAASKTAPQQAFSIGSSVRPSISGPNEVAEGYFVYTIDSLQPRSGFSVTWDGPPEDVQVRFHAGIDTVHISIPSLQTFLVQHELAILFGSLLLLLTVAVFYWRLLRKRSSDMGGAS